MGPRTCTICSPSMCWRSKIGRIAGASINAVDFQNSKMVVVQNAIMDQPKNPFARIPKKQTSSFQDKGVIVPILYPYTHSKIGRYACNCAARKRMVKYICAAQGLSPLLVLVIGAHTYFWLLKTWFADGELRPRWAPPHNSWYICLIYIYIYTFCCVCI